MFAVCIGTWVDEFDAKCVGVLHEPDDRIDRSVFISLVNFVR